MRALIENEFVERRILVVRGQKVMLDRDLAELYQVETKYLNRQVKRNLKRFPKEFAFKLTDNEKRELVTNWHQFKTLKHSSSNPLVFTEHGVAMLASVLNSHRAVQMSIYIIKAFVKLRELSMGHKEILSRLDHLERKASIHDDHIREIIQTIRGLVSIPEKPKRKIGFHQTHE